MTMEQCLQCKHGSWEPGKRGGIEVSIVLWTILEVIAILSVVGMFFWSHSCISVTDAPSIYIPEPFQCTQHIPLTAHPTF